MKAVKLLTLKCEFKMLKMQKSEGIKTSVTRVTKMVNQIQLIGE